ncbi:response regulator transcription factor [Sporomusa acidovorans]|uniref:Regulator of RpoS n=1 Tax=Sporomusa acidovorans (strain ATCC 49682 / DSM 3132 / Mol) TaxID=1123286 RepID=A0ABZ3IXM6_SPOA4|nr:response regulator [Sporomusa acidovorans]OZC22364.1 putative response regulatory protein [Sporomusa acidovorans DSM 3132]SDE46819.1 Two-component response regulator, YesN/AraC family, consists of REC and AraC-type DNA-binding domains [Sporomusa acidovorans]
MYKMVIADDEPAVRQYLRYIVKQYNLPFQICGEAEDGAQAVHLVDMHQPEFVILDINMPIMNGLEAAKAIRKKYRETMIYILTAYSQFDYAHQAVQTHVADYLLKPIKPAQLVETLRKGIAAALSQRMSKQRLERLEQQIAKDRPVVAQQRLFDLLKNDSVNPNALKILRSISKKDDFTPQAVISVSYWFNAEHLPVGIEVHLLQEAQDFLGEQAILASFSDEIVMLVANWDHGLRWALQNRLEDWESKYAITICAGISLVTDPSQIGRDYKHAKKKREAGMFWRQQGLLVIDGTVEGSKEIECEAIQKQIRQYVLERKPEKAKVAFRQFLSEAKQSFCQPEYMYAAIIKIANNLIEKYAEYMISADEAGKLRKNFLAEVNRAVSVDDLEQCLCVLIDKLESNSGSLEQNQAEQAVKWAIEYINTNYHKDLTLEQFAEKLFMSTGYFCRIFKKYAGEGYATYLTNIRLEKAKEILLTGRYTVNEVARMVGFRDASYFSSVFKKHYHQSPSAFTASAGKAGS